MGVKGGNRRRRAGMWVAGLAVIAAIGATIQLTRHPELVWCTSPRDRGWNQAMPRPGESLLKDEG